MSIAAVLKKLKPHAGKFYLTRAGEVRAKYARVPSSAPGPVPNVPACPLAYLCRKADRRAPVCNNSLFEFGRRLGLPRIDVYDFVVAADRQLSRFRIRVRRALRRRLLEALNLKEPR